MTKTTTALYKSPIEALQAVRFLEESGVSLSDISLIASHDFDKDGIIEKPHSKAPEGIVIGAASGGTLGGLIAGLSAASSIATGGASLGLLIAGPIAAALAGAGAGAAAGGVVGGMVGASIPEHDREFYEHAIQEGSVLVSVTSEDSDSLKLVKTTLEASGAERVS